MSASLLATRRFAPLFWCQFLSAFNDNFLKNALVALVVYVLARQDAAGLVQLGAATVAATPLQIRQLATAIGHVALTPRPSSGR